MKYHVMYFFYLPSSAIWLCFPPPWSEREQAFALGVGWHLQDRKKIIQMTSGLKLSYMLLTEFWQDIHLFLVHCLQRNDTNKVPHNLSYPSISCNDMCTVFQNIIYFFDSSRIYEKDLPWKLYILSSMVDLLFIQLPLTLGVIKKKRQIFLWEFPPHLWTGRCLIYFTPSGLKLKAKMFP